MYEIIINTHYTMRWIVLVMAVITLYQSWTGWMGNKPFSATDNKIGTFFVASLHLQLVLGLILYFTSPAIQQALADFGGSMKNAEHRLRMMEHPLLAIIAVTLAQIGRIKSKKAATDLEKHKKAAIFFTIALLLILLRMPKWL
ncbi:MAG: hypothetical protein K1X81_01375 [Bacteroidia bacterium]|nr:hypothetical protein [Bacteroidia bacterium]